MTRTVVLALQIALGLLLLLLMFAQVAVLPDAAADYARRYPEAASLRWPVLVLGVATVACVRVAVGCLAKWMSVVSRRVSFEPSVDRYVDSFVAAVGIASGLVMAIGIYVSATTGSPLWISCALVSLLGAGMALLVAANTDRLTTC